MEIKYLQIAPWHNLLPQKINPLLDLHLPGAKHRIGRLQLRDQPPQLTPQDGEGGPPFRNAVLVLVAMGREVQQLLDWTEILGRAARGEDDGWVLGRHLRRRK